MILKFLLYTMRGGINYNSLIDNRYLCDHYNDYFEIKYSRLMITIFLTIIPICLTVLQLVIFLRILCM